MARHVLDRIQTKHELLSYCTIETKLQPFHIHLIIHRYCQTHVLCLATLQQKKKALRPVACPRGLLEPCNVAEGTGVVPSSGCHRLECHVNQSVCAILTGPTPRARRWHLCRASCPAVALARVCLALAGRWVRSRTTPGARCYAPLLPRRSKGLRGMSTPNPASRATTSRCCNGGCPAKPTGSLWLRK